MTAQDLARWGWALLSGKLMPKRLVENAFADSLGWTRVQTSSGPAFVHQGQWIARQNTGVRTALALFPDSTVAALFLNTNVAYSPTRLLVEAFGLSRGRF